MARQTGERRKLSDAARAYLETYPEGSRATRAKALLREREPASPLPKSPPPGLARVFDLRSWSGEDSTRVVVDVERKVRIQYDRAYAPDRLWVDLVGTRLHPNLAERAFPVGDGLLEQVRIGQNRDDVVRVVLDFKDVGEHQVVFLEDPARLVIDVRGRSRPRPQIAAGPKAPEAASPDPVLRAPTRPIDGMVPAQPLPRRRRARSPSQASTASRPGRPLRVAPPRRPCRLLPSARSSPRLRRRRRRLRSRPPPIAPATTASPASSAWARAGS